MAFRFQSEPFEDVSVYRGDIIVGLKFIPPDSSMSQHQSSSSNSGGGSSGGTLNLRKFGSIKSSPTARNSSSKGSLHVLVKEGKNLTAVKANGSCDAFCKRYRFNNFIYVILIYYSFLNIKFQKIYIKPKLMFFGEIAILDSI